eukprot:7684278-Pyramimonas_sp.AAC.1
MRCINYRSAIIERRHLITQEGLNGQFYSVRCDIIITPTARPSSKRRAGVTLSSHQPLAPPLSAAQ